MQVEGLLRGLLKQLAHPHFKVRVSLVHALGELMRSAPHAASVEKFVVPFVQEATLDKSSQVRHALFGGMGPWLDSSGPPPATDGAGSDTGDADAPEATPPQAQTQTNLQEQQEPQGLKAPPYASLLLPPMLLGLTDDEEGIREGVTASLEEACARAAAQGFYGGPAMADGAPDSPDSPVSFEPAGDFSPAVRSVVCHHLSHLVSLSRKELNEWTLNRKRSAARLVFVATKIVGAKATALLDALVPLLCVGVEVEDEQVAGMVVRAAHNVGMACASAAWAPLVTSSLMNPKGSAGHKASALVVLAALLWGRSQASQDAVHGGAAGGVGEEGGVLASIVGALASEDVRGSTHPAVQAQLVAATTNVIAAYGPACIPVSRDIYHVLLQLQALQDNSPLREQALSVTEQLAHACGFGSVFAFAQEHSKELLEVLCQGQAAWDKDAADQHVFSALLFNCEQGVLAGLVGDVMGVFAGCVAKGRDPHVRLHALKLLDRLLEDGARRGCFEGVASRLLADVILPPCTWEVGKTAASIRFHAIVVLGTFFRTGMMARDELVSVLENAAMQLLPTVHSSLDEDYYRDTRLASCHAMVSILTTAGAALTDEHKRAVYPELLKRLDDSNDDVRVEACRALEALATHCLTAAYDDANTSYLVKGTLVHADDSNPDVQSAAARVVAAVGRTKPDVVRDCVMEVRGSHRDAHLLDGVLEGLPSGSEH